MLEWCAHLEFPQTKLAALLTKKIFDFYFPFSFFSCLLSFFLLSPSLSSFLILSLSLSQNPNKSPTLEKQAKQKAKKEQEKDLLSLSIEARSCSFRKGGLAVGGYRTLELEFVAGNFDRSS